MNTLFAYPYLSLGIWSLNGRDLAALAIQLRILGTETRFDFGS